MKVLKYTFLILLFANIAHSYEETGIAIPANITAKNTVNTPSERSKNSGSYLMNTRWNVTSQELYNDGAKVFNVQGRTLAVKLTFRNRYYDTNTSSFRTRSVFSIYDITNISEKIYHYGFYTNDYVPEPRKYKFNDGNAFFVTLQNYTLTIYGSRKDWLSSEPKPDESQKTIITYQELSGLWTANVTKYWRSSVIGYYLQIPQISWAPGSPMELGHATVRNDSDRSSSDYAALIVWNNNAWQTVQKTFLPTLGFTLTSAGEWNWNVSEITDDELIKALRGE